MVTSPTFGHDLWSIDPVGYAHLRESKSKSKWSKLILELYRVKLFRKMCLKICRRLEGHELYSVTLRRILAKFHGVEIGRYSYGSIFEPGALPRGTRIGAYCSIGKSLIVRRRDHPLTRMSQHPFFYNRALGYLTTDSIPSVVQNPLVIGNDVWIGDRVTILSGCRRIGNGAVLAAGAVVSHDVESYCIVGGVPARVIRRRFNAEVAQQIEKLKWWDLGVEDVMKKRDNFLIGLEDGTIFELGDNFHDEK